MGAEAMRIEARAVARRALDFLLPPACLACDARVDRQGTLCAPCWRAVTFLTPPHCAACGLPFPYPLGEEALCAACAATPPAFARARAAIAYDAGARPLITRLKYHDRHEGRATFARWMARAGGALLEDADIIAPVPLHRFRLIARRFNQAVLLGQALAPLSGKPFMADLLWRTRPTMPQVGLSPAGRQRNVAHAFAVRPRHAGRLRGKAVLLIDDVFTTGATVEACARALRRMGARRVDVLTLARVVAGRAIPI